MSEFKVTVSDMLEAGCHFGHQTKRWNPKMGKYIYTSKNGIHIINVNESMRLLKNAADVISKVITNGGSVMFIGTKKQAKHIIKQAAEECGMPYVNERWLGGMLTNQKTILKSIHKLEEMEKQVDGDESDAYTKKEIMTINKKKAKIERNLAGIRALKRFPDMMFIVDVMVEHLAVAEAKKLKIPIVGVIDTNCDPDLVDHVIPSNDDAMKAIQLIVNVIKDAVIESRGNVKVELLEQDRNRAEMGNDVAGVGEEVIDDDDDLANGLKKAKKIKEAGTEEGPLKTSKKPVKTVTRVVKDVKKVMPPKKVGK